MTSTTKKKSIRITRLTVRKPRGSRGIQKRKGLALAPMRHTSPPSSWTTLLEEAVRTPGPLHEGYRAFHNYSVGNQMLAMLQCYQRNLTPGPLNTYPGWKELGRQVRKR